MVLKLIRFRYDWIKDKKGSLNNNDPIPVMWFPNADNYLPFYQTRETLYDMKK